jgi:hypothetical protein
LFSEAEPLFDILKKPKQALLDTSSCLRALLDVSMDDFRAACGQLGIPIAASGLRRSSDWYLF